MTDPDRLAQIREYLGALYGKNVAGPQDLIDVKVKTLDWLVGEVERLRGLLGRLEWPETLPGAGPHHICPICNNVKEDGRGHEPDCWLAAELHPE